MVAKYKDAYTAMAQVLRELNIDLEDENFSDTPRRFVDYLVEYLQGKEVCGAPEAVLRTGFTATPHKYKGMIAQCNIPFRTICPHHLLPVVGHAHLGYIPGSRVVGLSKLTRLVHAVGTNSPRMQEDITDMLADALMDVLQPMGAIAVVSAEHMCMAGRGVASRGTPTVTSSVRGNFLVVPAARDEFFRLVAANHIG